MFIACVTPTPPGVTETLLETELDALTEATLWNVTGIPYAPRNTAMIPSLAAKLASSGSAIRTRAVRGSRRMAPPVASWARSLARRLQKIRASSTSRATPPPTRRARSAAWSETKPSLIENEPLTERKR